MQADQEPNARADAVRPRGSVSDIDGAVLADRVAWFLIDEFKRLPSCRRPEGVEAELASAKRGVANAFATIEEIDTQVKPLSQEIEMLRLAIIGSDKTDETLKNAAIELRNDLVTFNSILLAILNNEEYDETLVQRQDN